MCKEEKALGEPIYSSPAAEVYYDDLSKIIPPPKWIEEVLFSNDDESENEGESSNQSA